MSFNQHIGIFIDDIDKIFNSNNYIYTIFYNIFQYIKNRNKYLISKKYDSPKELLDNFEFEGKKMNEIWDELEWK